MRKGRKSCESSTKSNSEQKHEIIRKFAFLEQPTKGKPYYKTTDNIDQKCTPWKAVIIGGI